MPLRSIQLLVFVLSCTCVSLTFGQTYLGNIRYDNSYTYAKISVSDSSATFALPFFDADKKFEILGDIMSDTLWSVQRNHETFRFNTTLIHGRLEGTLTHHGLEQPLTFYQQLAPLPADALAAYEGTYIDTEGHRSLIYERNGYLHYISPYSGQSMSLKPIGKDIFWSVSGEQVHFVRDSSNELKGISYFDRFQNTKRIEKMPPIQIEEIYVVVGKDSLFTKLFIPAATGKVPACLVLPGGGSVGMSNYEYEARFFASHGILAMVFDKAGNGKSKGPGNFQAQTFEDKNKQYLALFKHLQRHPKVAYSKVGVHGPSEGGRLALMMAIDEPEVAFVNATAAPMMSMQEGQLYAIDHYLRNRGISETDIIGIRQVWKEYYKGIISKHIPKETIERANSFRNSYEGLFIPPNSQDIPLSPNASDLQNDRVVVEAGKIECPILIQYGENDERVDPEKSLQNFFKYANKNTAVTVITYPRANHSFMTPGYEISHGYLRDKLVWLQTIGILNP